MDDRQWSERDLCSKGSDVLADGGQLLGMNGGK